MNCLTLDYDSCVAICCSDSTVYVHWSISNLSRQVFEECFLCDWEDTSQVLIVYDVSSTHFNGHNANGFKEYPILNDQCYMFLDLPKNRRYVMDVAVKQANSFYTILRSNFISLSIRKGHFIEAANHPLFEGKAQYVSPPEWSHFFSTYSCYAKT